MVNPYGRTPFENCHCVHAALDDLRFLTQVSSVPAAEAALEPRMAHLHPEIEPLVRLIEECRATACWKKK
jgi:hypothetical protein